MSETEREPVTGEKRWVANQFWQGGATKYPRLDEARNFHDPNATGVFDTSDEDLARAILQRAGLAGHLKYEDLVKTIGQAFSRSVRNPQKWLNPVYGESSEHQHSVGGGTTTDTTATPVRKDDSGPSSSTSSSGSKTTNQGKK